jgi:hypothetical protein
VLRRGRFGDVISRQLDLFEREQAGLVRECEEAEAAYNRADREDAEQRYGDYQDLVDLRDNFASTLGEAEAERYEAEFNRAVAKRLPRFALEIENR